jgi:hypothetical protein
LGIGAFPWHIQSELAIKVVQLFYPGMFSGAYSEEWQDQSKIRKRVISYIG